MPRSTRVHAPGVAFHVVAVTQGRAKWFNDVIRRRISSDVDEAAAHGGHRVLARVVMPNHFHVIVRCGSAPLGWMMQRILQRAAWQVRKQHDVEGHVFGQRYWAEPIPTPAYLRRAIVYTHLNPCKAGLCEEPAAYEFSSHERYVHATLAEPNGFADGLMLFADESTSLNSAINNYLEFVRHCQERRRSGVEGDWLLPGTAFFGSAPLARLGDEHWAKTYTHFEPVSRIGKSVDVQALAVTALRRIDPNLDLDTLRFGKRHEALVEPRRELVSSLLGARCKNASIARLLGISPSAVSKQAALMRNSARDH